MQSVLGALGPASLIAGNSQGGANAFGVPELSSKEITLVAWSMGAVYLACLPRYESGSAFNAFCCQPVVRGRAADCGSSGAAGLRMGARAWNGCCEISHSKMAACILAGSVFYATEVLYMTLDSERASQSPAPALDNGLLMLERLAEAGGPLGFSQLVESVSVSRTSAVRLLKVLQGRQWIVKNADSGKYCVGPRFCALCGRGSVMELLRDHSAPILRSLVEKTRNTCLAVYWDGRQMQCVQKEIHMRSVPMQDLGAVYADLSHAPWGWIIYESLDQNEKRRAALLFADKQLFFERYEAWMAAYRREGYAYDDQTVCKPLRRLGAPVYDRSGVIVGGVGLGGNPLTIRNGDVKAYGRLLAEHARRLSMLLGRRSAPAGE